MPKETQQPTEETQPTPEADDAFILRFERFDIDFNDEWFRNQYNHLRTTWHYLKKHNNFSIGFQDIRYRYIRYHRRFNAGNMYHETITRFWASMVWARMRKSKASTFDEFIANNEDLLNYGLTFEYYSGLVLANDKARAQWFTPDKKTIE